jgi:c-di-GMP-binding flagellar brake protein YcgR
MSQMTQKKRQHNRSKATLYVSLSIHCINNKEIKTGQAIVHLEDISLGGLSFESELNFPADGDFILKFENILFGSMYGNIRWKQKEENGYRYGVQFLSVSNVLYRLLINESHFRINNELVRKYETGARTLIGSPITHR